MDKEHIQFTKENFFIEGLLEEGRNLYVLEENEKGGESRLTVHCQNETIYLRNCDKKKTDVGFFREDKKCGMKKRVDHIVFENTEANNWNVHLIEMKSSVTGEPQWSEIKGKFRASYYLAKMLAVVLELQISRFMMYTTYGLVTLDKCNVDPAVRKARLGYPAVNPKEEWDGGAFALYIGSRRNFRHTPIEMRRDGNGMLVGELVL